ncbi:ankyrin repeat and SOCS box protein 3-like [Oppia nitens]|uniref:ankyrin repeat and SOCS box protein 3-like n=1 Tax=Oppia nitens TaxID=1686743 RepID=UPI0023DB5A64|nr:ankyrin repeat and SOCS box protein 3-like [Oppia nitens]
MDFKEHYTDSSSSVANAVRIQDLKLLRKLIRDGKCVDVMDNRGWRPLHQAAICKNVNSHQLVDELLKHEDTDPDWRSHEGETALLLACRHNIGPEGLKVIETLLKHKSNPNIADNEEETPLLAATRSGQSAAVQLLVKHERVDKNQADCGGWSPLHESATRGDLVMTQTLITFGAKLESKDECGMTPIFTAAQHGRLDCLKILVTEAVAKQQKYLLDEGANDGASPVMIAAQQGFTDCIELLLKSGANPNSYAKDGVNAIHLAAECGHHKTLELLLKKLNTKDMESQLKPESPELRLRNPLHLAISSDRQKCLKVMLKSGFDINSVDLLFEQKFSLAMPSPKYITPLSLAVTLNNWDAVRLLLRYGADVNTDHPNVYAPVHCVFSVIDNEFERGADDNLNILELLCRRGAHINYCRSATEPNELLHALFAPSSLQVLLRYGLDLRSCFKEGYIGRFLSMSFHLVTLHWYHNVLPVVSHLVERNAIVRDHMSALAHHIESIYKMRFGIDEYNPSVWKSIFDLFERPHTLKECARFAIRRQVYAKCRSNGQLFPEMIDSLDVPEIMHEYLLFKEFAIRPVLV